MALFLHRDALAQRKILLRDATALGGLAGSLQHELHAALDIPVPDGKSRLTRNAGRCVACTVLLTFDPRSPFAHTCPVCGTVYHDQVHHEWWLMNGHLWTAEQCTRAAALAYLLDDASAASRADEILATYADRYLRWPNCDNALGPTRPFFSTYLESIWLLHLATALDLRDAADSAPASSRGVIIERLIAPSAALIASFNEGRSNRQVWHAAALLAASAVLYDRRMRDDAVDSLIALLRSGLHTDGSWYEGENYHLFAHRGLLSAVTLAENAGVELPRDLVQRFELGFAAPFRTMLPDGTFPARRDSQYGIALRQYRTADWAECGFARADTPEMRAALASLYARWPEPGDTFRWASSADAERNMPGVRLTRADCGWRALLLARPELPALHDSVAHSELLEGQGLAVFRRDKGRLWVGLDYGDPGAGHGHPDRLNLLIAREDWRLLDDVGTGSYTSPTLMWYRSSMAHNAPMVNGRDQGPAAGTLLAHDEQDTVGWVSAEFIDPLSRVRFVRTVVVTPDHILDELSWSSESDVFVDVPMQAKVIPIGREYWAPFTPTSSQDAWLTEIESIAMAAGVDRFLVLQPLRSLVTRETEMDPAAAFFCTVWTATAATLWRARTIGPPAGKDHGLVSLRQSGRSGRSVRCFPLDMPVATFKVDEIGIDIGVALFKVDEIGIDIGVVLEDGHWRHTRVATGWSVEHTTAAGLQRSFELGGLRSVSAPAAAPPTPEPEIIHVLSHAALTRELSEADYRITEETWQAAGRPTATVQLSAADGQSIRVHVRATLNRRPHFTPAIDVNPLDNELADVNSDGVQLHWRSAVTGDWNSVIAVVEGDHTRLTAAEGALDGLTAVGHAEDAGFVMSLSVPWPDPTQPFAFDVIVNDCPPTRERRRGQLVFSGAHGESAYLRGARQSPDRAVHVVFDPAAP